MGQDSGMEFWEKDIPGLAHIQRGSVLKRLEVATTRSERRVLRRRLKDLEHQISENADERWRKLVAAQLWCPDCGGAFGNNKRPRQSMRRGMGPVHRATDYGVGPDDYHNRDGRHPRLINPVTGEHRWCKCPTGLDRESDGSVHAAAHDEPVTRARRGGPAKARRSRPVSVANELKKLAALRDDDVISEQEFQTLKQKLIEGA